MANIHTQVKDGKLEVTHQGESKTFEMPTWMSDMGEEGMLQDEDALVKHLKDHGMLLGFLHAGLKECLVGLRAHIRPKEDVSITSDKAGDPMTYKPKAQDVPQVGSNKKITPEMALETLKGSMSKEELLELISKMA